MPFQGLQGHVKPAIKSLESDKGQKKGLVAKSRQALSDLQELKTWDWKKHSTEDKPCEQ